jgi:hypothetical protein
LSRALSRWATSTYEGTPLEALSEPDETQLTHLIGLKAETADLVMLRAKKGLIQQHIADTAMFGDTATDLAEDFGGNQSEDAGGSGPFRLPKDGLALGDLLRAAREPPSSTRRCHHSRHQPAFDAMGYLLLACERK